MQEESQFQKSPQTESRLIRDLPKGLIQWYPFSKGAKALFLSGGEEVCEVLPEAMEECGLLADCIPLSVLQHASPSLKASAYDYIILAGAIERTPSPQAFLSSLRPLLTPKGRLLIGAQIDWPSAISAATAIPFPIAILTASRTTSALVR